MKKRKFLAICVAITLILSAFFLTGFTQPSNSTAQAQSGQASRLFANRYVMDDLRESVMDDGRIFDERDFPYTPSLRQVRMLHFVEYAFTFHARHRANFGLFVYLWNPARLDIVPNSPHNTIQMATRYDANGRPNLYEKLPLRFLSRSTGNVEGLFYKFEVVLEGEHRASLLSRLSENLGQGSALRRYDISGIELTTRPTFRATDFHVGRTIRFSGFAQGHGEHPNSESNLSIEVDGLRTLELDVRSTWYRTPTSIRGIGHQHQINTVYFSVPNYILEEYGQLQRIMAEWHEFQTQPIFVTSRRSLYNRFINNIGNRTERNFNLHYGIYRGFQGGGSSSLSASWGFNDVGNFIRTSGHHVGQLERYMHYLFHVNNIETFSGTDLPVGSVSSEQLSNWIFNYNASFRNGHLPIPSRQVSADLFTNTIDADRLAQGIRRGHNIQEIDAGDVQDLLFYDNVRRTSFWQRFWSGGQQFVFGDLMSEGLKPIEALPEIFPVGTNAQLSRQLFVNMADIPDLRSFHATATANYETVFLFRFAVTDYHARWLTIFDDKDLAWWEIITLGLLQQRTRYEGQMYKAQQTVFLDFDIISLTFYGQFGYIVIPVVMSPIDIIPDITPPAYDPPPQWDWTNWFRLLLGLILLILLLVLLTPFLPIIATIIVFIIKIILAVILFPFRILAGLMRSHNRRRKRNKQRKRQEQFDRGGGYG